MSAAPQRLPWPVAGLAVMSLAVFLSITTEMLPTGLLPAMSRSLDVSHGQLGLLVTAYALIVLHAGFAERDVGPVLLGYGIAGGVGLLAAGIFVDRRLRAGMLAGAATLAVALAVLAFGPTSTALAAGAVGITGVALGSVPVFLQTATLRAAPNATDVASGLNASAFNIGIGGGALLGGVTLDHLGPAALPAVAAILVSAGFVAIALGRRVGQPAAAPG